MGPCCALVLPVDLLSVVPHQMVGSSFLQPALRRKPSVGLERISPLCTPIQICQLANLEKKLVSTWLNNCSLA